MAFTVNTSLSYLSYVNVNFPYIEVPTNTTGPVTVTLQASVTPSIQAYLTTSKTNNAISFWDESGLWTAKGPVAEVNQLMAGLMWFPGGMGSPFTFTYKCVDNTGATVGTGSVVMSGAQSRPAPTVTDASPIVTMVPNVTNSYDLATVGDPVNGFLTATIQFNRVPGDANYTANPIVKSGVEAAGYGQILSGYYGNSKSNWNSGTLTADPNDASRFPVWSMYGPSDEVRAALKNLRLKTPATIKPFQVDLKVSNGTGPSSRLAIPADQPSSNYTFTISFTNPAAVNEDVAINIVGTLSGNAASRLHTLTFNVGNNVQNAYLNTANTKITTTFDNVTKTATFVGYYADMVTAISNGIRLAPVDDYNGSFSVPWTLAMEGNSAITQSGTIPVTFNSVNDAPKWTADIEQVTLLEGGVGSTRQAQAYDPDVGSTITGYSLSGGNANINATIVSSTGVITIPSTVLFLSDLSNFVTTFTVTATSSDGSTATKNFNATYQHQVTLAQSFTF